MTSQLGTEKSLTFFYSVCPVIDGGGGIAQEAAEEGGERDERRLQGGAGGAGGIGGDREVSRGMARIFPLHVP